MHKSDIIDRSQWPRSKAWVCGNSLSGIVGSNPVGDIDPVSCEWFVLSVRGLCVGLITRPEESYRVWSLSLDIVEALAH